MHSSVPAPGAAAHKGLADATRDVVILGSTGSIGTQALDVIGRHRDSFRVLGLGAGGANLELLARQAITFDVPVLAVADVDAAAPLAALLAERSPGRMFQILSGPDAMAELAGGWQGIAVDDGGVATSSDSSRVVVLNAITGSINHIAQGFLDVLHRGRSHGSPGCLGRTRVGRG